MTFWHRSRSWIQAALRRSRMESSMDAELSSHIEAYADDLVRNGAPPEEAMRRARIEFGGIERVKEECRESRGVHFIEDLVQDMRLALRVLRKSPGFTAVIVLTLALGIGANTVIFSVVNAVLLRSLPYVNSGQLLFLSEGRPRQSISGLGMSYAGFTELRGNNRVFSAIAGFGGHALVLTGYGEPSEMSTVAVTSEFFSVFGTEPLLGRIFRAEDGKPGAFPVVVLSEDLWRNRFGADPAIVGRSINLDMRSYSVIGVMPATFQTPFLNRAEQVWIPLAQDPLFSVWMTRPPQQHWMAVIARARSGISSVRVRIELDTIGARLATTDPAEKGWTMRAGPLQQAIAGDVKLPLLVLMGAVGLVLLIACVNIANLLLSRASSRSREIAIRFALGAGARRIARQLLTECAVLGLLGGLIGILIAHWGIGILVPRLPAGLPQFHAIRMDGGVVAFVFLLSITTSLVFGLAPVLSVSSYPHKQLGESGRAGESAGPRRARAFLAVAEIALSIVLLVGAGLLIRSFAHLTSVNPGFEPEHVVKAMISLPQFQYSTPRQWAAFSEELAIHLEAKPGMRNSAVTGPLPIVDCCISLEFQIAGNPKAREGTVDTADYVPASPRYFSVMRIPLLRGRLFDQFDSFSSIPVALISQALAKRYFHGEDPLGRHLIFGFPANGIASREIIGIVGDVHDVSLGKEPGPMFYVPFAQAPLYGCEVVVRSTLSASAVAGAIRDTTHSIDKNLPVTDIAELPDVLKKSVAQVQFRTLLLGLFAAIALILAGVGIFGVISYAVSRRTRELAIRMALGAHPSAVMRMILRETLALTLTGIVIGVPCAIAAARLLTHLLFNIPLYDPITLPLVCFAIVAVGALAGYIPAHRAMKVDPIAALRYE